MEQTKKHNKLEHPCFSQPSDTNVKVWRYMDLSKFLSIISKESLFLSRLDMLPDTHEGSITKINYLARQIEFQKYGIKDFIVKDGEVNQRDRKMLFVNCWCLSQYESEAMWKLYCPDNNGIVLQTTYKKLVSSIEYDDFLYIGQVTYLDYETEWFPTGNLFYPVMHKRKAFEYEREVRLVKTDSKYWKMGSEEPPIGMYCPWKINATIENIFINPYAGAWYYETVLDVLKRYEIDINTVWSALKGIPYY